MSVRVVVATDGSTSSLAAARSLRDFVDPAKVAEVLVVAVLTPTAAVPFRDELGGTSPSADLTTPSYRREAEGALQVVARAFEGWPGVVRTQVRSGSPTAEIVRAAQELPADLVVVSADSSGLTETVLMGSTAQRLQHSAPCPVLVWRARRR